MAREAFDLATLASGGGLPQNYYSANHAAVSADGRYVVFRSDETGLVSPNTEGYQIFLRDRLLGTTELMSQSGSGAYGNGSSDWPAVSDDGCRVVFESDSSNLVAGDANGTTDVFVRNRCAVPPSTALVSVDSAGTQANGESNRADISADGKFVAFWSYATSLVTGVSNPGQIYRRNLATGTTTLVSASVVNAGNGGNVSSDCPAISDDGSRIAFWSYASDLVSADTNGLWDMFVHDAGTGQTTLVSSSSAGAQQNQGGEGTSSVSCPAISGDGRYVAFPSRSTNLVPGDTDTADIFVKDTTTGALSKASVDSAGNGGNGDSAYRPSLSKDGTWVAFHSDATNLAAAGSNIFLHNIVTGQTLGFTNGASPDLYPVISGDPHGRFLVDFWGEHLDSRYASSGVFVHDRHHQPVADAGVTQTVKAGDTVTLDGSKSYEPDNDFPLPNPGLTYHWTQTDGPAAVTLTDPRAVKPAFVAAADGTYRFQLVVNDTVEDSEPSFVTISVGGATLVTPETPGPSVDPQTGTSVTLLTPDDGSPWFVGRKYSIQWNSANVPKKKKLALILLQDSAGNRFKVIRYGVKKSGTLRVKVKRSWATDTAWMMVCAFKNLKEAYACDAGNAFVIESGR